MNQAQVAEWLARWREIRTRGNLSDYELACFYRDLVKAVGLAAANGFVSDKLGEGPGGVGRYGEMCGALDIVTDKAVWQAVGWKGVQKILTVADEDKRLEICGRVLEAAKVSGGVVGFSDLTALVKPYAVSESSSKPAPTMRVMGAVRKADILTVEIRNLVDAGVVKPEQISAMARHVVEEAFGPLTGTAKTSRLARAS